LPFTSRIYTAEDDMFWVKRTAEKIEEKRII
jgi:hypothetical protein